MSISVKSDFKNSEVTYVSQNPKEKNWLYHEIDNLRRLKLHIPKY